MRTSLSHTGTLSMKNVRHMQYGGDTYSILDIDWLWFHGIHVGPIILSMTSSILFWSGDS
jgi:hypothetical protein